MTHSATEANPTQSGPTIRQMLKLWVPLAASIVMMVLEPSIINIGLGRTGNPELALAAFGVAFGLALLIEAPIIMLLDASVARSSDRATFGLMRRFTLVLALIVTAAGLIVSLSPLYHLIVVDLMNIPPEVAVRARPTLQILSFWPLPIAWRRAHQGVLIRVNRTAPITMATGARLLTLACAMYAGMYLFPRAGAIVAGLAMVLSASVEAVLITLATRPVLGSPAFQALPSGGESLTPRGLWRFYRPLAMTSILRQVARPVLNAGIAAVMLPTASLAAWPVAWGFVVLVAGPAWSLQQLTTALAEDRLAYQRVRNFALSLSAFFSLLLALVAFTPLYGLVMGGIYNLSPMLQALARPAMQMMVIFPLLLGAQSVLRGVLIRAGCTGDVRTSMAINVGTLTLTVILSVAFLSPTGTVLAAMASLTGGVAELVWLRLKTRT